MVSFTNDPSEWDRLDYQILQNSAIGLYFQDKILLEDSDWLRNNGYIIHVLDAAKWSSEKAFHTEVSNLLQFPDYYGKNLEAFNDCLSDLEIPDAGGLALQILRFNKFAGLLPKFAHSILDIIANNSRRFLLTGHRFMALVQSDDPESAFACLGCTAANWNPREWTMEKREL